MITIKNTQRKIAVNTRKVIGDSEKMLKALGYESFDFGIWFTTNQTIRRFNKKYRNTNKPTDILSFPYHYNLKPGEKIKVAGPDDKNLGDLIISLEYVKVNAKKTWNRSFDEHLTALIAHGIAHLLGYDHITDNESELMQKIEKKLRKAILS